jgi:hypothetical protein
MFTTTTGNPDPNAGNTGNLPGGTNPGAPTNTGGLMTGGANTEGGAPKVGNNPVVNTANAGGAYTGGANTGGSTSNPGGAGSTASTQGAAPVPFALNPGVAMGNMILDYNQKAHNWIYEQTIRTLYQVPTDRFDLSATSIPVFLTQISLRLHMVGSLILWAFGKGRHLCQCHAEYTLLQFRVKANT